MPPLTIPTAEPFLIPGGNTGCLLVHGFTGTPKEMRWLGDYLAEQGHTVLAVRLPGHATRPDDMLRVHWQDWLATVEDGLNLLRGLSKRIYILGLSMGGSLALLAAARLPVDGVVAMSTPYDLPDDWRLPYIGIFSIFQPTISKGQSDWRNPQAELDHICYPGYPTRAIHELDELLRAEREALPNVQVPVLLVHSRKDQSIKPDNMEKIYQHVGSREKQMMWVENSGHVIIREPERQKVFEATADFIRGLNGTE